MVAARFPFLVSVALMAEYRLVLLRRSIQEKHQLEDDQVDKILTDIALNGIVVEPPIDASAPDAGDQHLWDLLATRSGAVLVTGDDKLLKNPPEGASVLFAARLRRARYSTVTLLARFRGWSTSAPRRTAT